MAFFLLLAFPMPRAHACDENGFAQLIKRLETSRYPEELVVLKRRRLFPELRAEADGTLVFERNQGVTPSKNLETGKTEALPLTVRATVAPDLSTTIEIQLQRPPGLSEDDWVDRAGQAYSHLIATRSLPSLGTQVGDINTGTISLRFPNNTPGIPHVYLVDYLKLLEDTIQ